MKTLKQLLIEQFNKDYNKLAWEELQIDSNDIIVKAVREWLTQKRHKIDLLQKGATFTDGKEKMIECGKQFAIKELLEELNQQ